MKTLSVLLFTSLISLGLISSDGFKEEQKRYARVRTAYSEKEEGMQQLLREKAVSISDFDIYIRIFKQEKQLELWGKNKSTDSFELIKIYDICRTSGGPGPKRKQGDLQIPEGFYHIDIFNPASSFYLSLGINYPNKSDRILGKQGSLGGDIFIHGDCVTIGCVPITDDQIKELYVFCVEAKDKGQNKIPVTIFPARLSDYQFEYLKEQYSNDADKVNLWKDLKIAFDLFSQDNQLPSITFLSDGRHELK